MGGRGRELKNRAASRGIVLTMPPHSIGSGTISFGLVTIPVKMFTATSPAGVSFNMLHAKCGSRLRQQMFCPACNVVVERADTVRGYEFAKDQYVRIADQELKALEGEASKMIDIAEFVPLEKVDPIYFERTYYLGPDKGGEKAYRLLADAMAKSSRVALAKFVMRGKESLVLVRSAQDGLMLHTMYFADEVRDFGEIDKGQSAKIRGGEMELAQQLIDGLTNDDFKPDQYADEYRQRVLDMINRKVEGQEVTVAAPAPPRAQVVDLMEALKESLAKRKPPAKVTPKRAEPARAEPIRAARRASGKK
jgi:DNA end-binding protein Ku